MHLLACILLGVFASSKAVSLPSLYSSDDPILQLSNDNFDSLIYRQKKSFFVEFYSSWCGHCKHFAPIWKQLAVDVELWNNVVQIAAVDCADDRNTPVCRSQNIEAYPTLKYFPYNSFGANDSIQYNSGRKASEMRVGLLKEIVGNTNVSRPFNWPNFDPIFGNATIDELYADAVRSMQGVEFIVVIVEDAHATLSLEVAMDLSSQAQFITVRKSDPRTDFAVKYVHSIGPSVVVFKGDDIKSDPLFVSSSALNREQMVGEIVKATGIRLHYPSRKKIPRSTKLSVKKQFTTTKLANLIEKKKSSLSSVVDYRDIRAALAYLLRHEIAAKLALDGPKFLAAKNFVQLLKERFPSDNTLKQFLVEFNTWFSAQGSGLAGVLISERLEELSTKYTHALPSSIRWYSCQGSKPHYRGYPCGLWSLFHTLTVQAFNLQNDKQLSNSLEVMGSIRDFVLNIFGCSECSSNFAKETLDLTDLVTGVHLIDSYEKTVLYLWRVHNSVNRRLSGDRTEDPRHPKLQFPSASQCPQCHHANGSWLEHEILPFLRAFYSPKPIGLDHIKELETPNDHDMFGQRIDTSGWIKLFSGLDISFCLILWVVSIVMLALCYLFLRRRGFIFRRQRGWKRVEGEWKV